MLFIPIYNKFKRIKFRRYIYIYILENSITYVGVQALSHGFKYINKLVTLSLAGNDLKPIGINALCDEISQLRDLQRLWLYSILLYIIGCKIEDEGIKLLSTHLKEISKLTKLSIGENNITEIGMYSLLRNITVLTDLTGLGISCILYNNLVNPIGDAGILCISKSFSSLRNLTNLIAEDVKMTDKGFQNICGELHHLTKLEVLMIRNNKLTDQSLQYLNKEIKYLPNLHKIYLDGNKFKKADIDILVDNDVTVYIEAKFVKKGYSLFPYEI